MVGHSHFTLLDWDAQCGEVSTLDVKQLPKLRGTSECRVQVGESYFYRRL